MKKILILILSLLTINFVSKAQVELTSTSVGATYYVTVPGTFVLTPGLQVTFKANVDNSASMSLDVSGTGAKPIRKLGGSQPLSGSDILANQIVTVAYDGTNWQMLSAVGSTPAASNDWTLTGNAISAGNQLGTTNAFDLSIIAGGTTAITIDDVSQNIGIGVAPSTFYKIYTNIPNSNTTSYTANEIQHNYSGASTKTGVSSIVSADGSGLKRTFYGFASASGTQQTDGFYSMIDNDGSGDAHGVYNDFSLSTGSGAQEGMRSIISNAGTSFKRGVFTSINQSGGANSSDMAGVHNSMASTSTTSQDMFGMISQINNSSPTGSSYGIYQQFSGTSTGTQYGIYSSGEDLNYFSGSMNIGGAFLPGGIAGAAGQVLTSSGGGVNTWSTPAASVNIYNSNGSLTNPRIVTQGGNTLAFTASAVNAFSVDGSTFSVDASNNYVGIGTTAPSQKLEVNGGQIYSIWANPNSIPNVMIRNWNSGTGPGYLTGTLGQVTIVTSDAAEDKYAIQGAAGGNSGNKYGVYGTSMGLGVNYGGRFSANGGSSNYALYAVGDAAGTSNGTGTFSTVGGSGSGTTYGIYGQNSSSSTSATYAGYFENFNSTGSIIYGVRSNLTGNAGGTVTKYGIRSDVIGTASSNIGGYFRAVGGTTNHAIQLVDGSEANNRVLASDAAGNATWTDLTALSSGSTAWTRSTPNIYPTTLTDNVIIGATSGSGKLTVYGSNDPLLLLDGPVGAQTPLVFATAGANKWAWYLPSGGADLTLWHYGAPSQNYINFNGTNGHVSIVPTAGNVGIGGVATPSEKLEVSGNIELSASTNEFMINNTRALSMNGTQSIYLGDNAAAGLYSTIIGYQAGNVSTGISNTFVGRQSGLVNTTGGQNAFYGIQSGAGNTTGQYNTFIGRSAGLTNSTGNNNTILGGTADVASGALTYATAIGYGATIAQSYGMALGGTGANAIEVGIGVNNNMAGKLHVYSSTPTYNISGTDYNSAVYGEVVGAVYSSRGIMGVSWATGTYGIGAYGSAQGAATNNYGVYGYASGGTNNYAGYFDAGNVFINNRLGINDPAPSYELDVSSLTTTYAGRFRNTGTGGADGLRVEVITAASTTGTRYGTYSIVQNGLGIQYGILGIAQTGGTTNYGVYGAASGGSTNNYAIYCAGSGGYTGTWSLISDQRFKENIKPLTGALDKILSLEPKTYNLKAKEYSYLNFPAGTQIGLISQEVEKIIPELVEKASHPGPIDEKTGEPTGNPIEFKSMNYIGLTPVLVQAIKEQQAIIEDLKKQLEAQKLRIDAIENK